LQNNLATGDVCAAWLLLGSSVIMAWNSSINARMGTSWNYPLENIHKATENGPVEIVDLPSYKMVIFHSYVSLPEGK